MGKRIITVPKSQEAEYNLDFDQASKEELIELPLSEEEFLFLWNIELFDQINKETNSMIDDFEEEDISTKENIERAVNILISKKTLFLSKARLYKNILCHVLI